MNERSIWEGILIPHNFFGIFLTYEDKLSRPLRFIIYFIGVNILISVTILFNRGLNQIQTIIFSIIAAIFIGIPVAILKAMFKNSKKLVKIIGLVVSLILYLTCLYTILTSMAFIGVEDSNKWTINYI